MYVLFWVFPRRLIKIAVCRRFGTLYQFHFQRLDVRYEVWLLRSGRGIYTGDLVPCINTKEKRDNHTVHNKPTAPEHASLIPPPSTPAHPL